MTTFWCVLAALWCVFGSASFEQWGRPLARDRWLVAMVACVALAGICFRLALEGMR